MPLAEPLSVPVTPSVDRPMGYRQGANDISPAIQAASQPSDVEIQIGELPVKTTDGQVFTENDDGSISIIPTASVAKDAPDDFDANLAEHADSVHLSMAVEDILSGIELDLQSRQEMVDTYINGMDLLGLKVEKPGGTLNRKKTSTVRCPLLTEAIVKFQSGCRGELLPAAGPAKIRNDGDDTEVENSLADAFEKDFNFYLSVTATEFYPDTDRMFWYLGYGGTTFKKVYRCPLRKRPVSEAVYLPDLIVSNDATDLDNAARVTHQISMSKSTVKRLKLAGFYRDVDLVTPTGAIDPIKMKERELQGQSTQVARPEEAHRTIYETIVEIDPTDLGLKEKGAPDGLPLPYLVSIDKDSRECLRLARHWKPDDEDYRKRRMFVKYGLIPGFGFLDYGFLHLLGNQTRALTAIWRILCDSGMFSNFPGGVKLKGTRATPSNINPGPGEFVDVDGGDLSQADIRKVIMAMPYKDVSAVFMQFAQMVEQDSLRLSGAVELEVGEGKANMPVGTMMALVEQQTAIMQAVHKRLHTSQQLELIMIRDLFAENPRDLWRLNKKPAHQWQEAAEFMDMDLTPASDPNVPASVHRLMQTNVLVMLAQQAPQLFDLEKVLLRALRGIGISDGQSYLSQDQQQQGAQGAGDAAAAIAAGQQAQAQATAAEAQAKAAENQREALNQALTHQQTMTEIKNDAEQAAADRQSKEKLAGLKAQTDAAKMASAEKMTLLKLAADERKAGLGAKTAQLDRTHQAIQNNADRQTQLKNALWAFNQPGAAPASNEPPTGGQ